MNFAVVSPRLVYVAIDDRAPVAARSRRLTVGAGRYVGGSLGAHDVADETMERRSPGVNRASWVWSCGLVVLLELVTEAPLAAYHA